MNVVIVALAVAIAACVAALLYGGVRWKRGTRALHARLEAAREPIAVTTFDPRALGELPVPVQRYLSAALVPGQPIIAAVNVRHRGTFDVGSPRARWRPFASEQRVTTNRPGFDWNARVAVAAGIAVRVHDAYIGGEGILRAALMGIVTVAATEGRGDIARGELMRFLAEAAWYPTALLPSERLRWGAIDNRSASATLIDGDVAVTLRFAFGDDGFVETVSAQSRGRTVGRNIVPTPWQARVWNYAVRDGMRVPLDGEVAWILPEGAKPYWRGHIEALAYEFAR